MTKELIKSLGLDTNLIKSSKGFELHKGKAYPLFNYLDKSYQEEVLGYFIHLGRLRNEKWKAHFLSLFDDYKNMQLFSADYSSLSVHFKYHYIPSLATGKSFKISKELVEIKAGIDTTYLSTHGNSGLLYADSRDFAWV